MLGEGTKKAFPQTYADVAQQVEQLICFLMMTMDKNMNENKQKGLLTELQCQAYFTQLGYNVSVPLGQDCRYDMIVDVKGQLIKIQVKTAHLNEGNTGIVFATRSTQGGNTAHEIQAKKYKKEDVDFFATYWENQCYLIRVEDCQSTKRTLSFEQVKVNQADVFFIKNYTVESTLYRFINNLPEPKVKTKVFQFDNNHNLIAEYDTITEAAKAVKGSNSHIGQAIKGEHHTAYGFLWERKFV